ncbi:MAG: ankyrin repeat domain-containing protein [Gaiellaceae bacterium]
MSDVLQALYRGDGAEAERLAAGRELSVFEAAALGRTDRLRALLDEDPSRAKAFGDDGFHPLGLACFFGHLDAARLLLERGADVNVRSRNEHIQTAAIHAAAASSETGSDEATRYELVKLVLEHGADPNLPQGGGFRALDAARQNGDTRVEQLLLDHGASG